MNGIALEERISRVETRLHSYLSDVTEARADIRDLREHVREWHGSTIDEVSRLVGVVVDLRSKIDVLTELVQSMANPKTKPKPRPRPRPKRK